MRNTLVYLYFILLISIDGFTQPYTIERLGLLEGLSSNFIVSMAQDKSGYMWFATENGLNKFDGKSFRVYQKNPLEKFSLRGNALNKVLVDNTDGIVWVASQREGLYAFDTQQELFTCYLKQENNSKYIQANDITDIINDKQGNLWISFYHEGFDYFDKKLNEFIHYNKEKIPGLVSNMIWSLADDGKGNLYIGHVNSGLSIYNTLTNRVINFTNNPNDANSLPGNEIRSIYIDDINNVWVGTNNGLALFNNDSKTFVVFKNNPHIPNSLSSNTIMCINQLQDKSLWIGTENGGISILDMGEALFHSTDKVVFQNILKEDTENGLSNTTVRSIFQDSFNNIWIGTYGGGINFISNKPRFFNTWKYATLPGIKNSLNHRVAWGICIDNAEQAWVGTDGGGINLFKNGENTKIFSKENSSLTDNAILSAFKSSDGTLWFGTYNKGVNYYKESKPYFEQLDLIDNNIFDTRCFFEDTNMNLWIGTDIGLFSYNLVSKKIKRFCVENSGFPDNIIRSISMDTLGRLWIGTFGEGLFIMDLSNPYKIQRFYKDNGFVSNLINHIYKDADNRMWIATDEGIVLFKNAVDTVYKVFNEKDGVLGNIVFAITQGVENEIWFSTNKGINNFRITDNKFSIYDQYDGIPLGMFNSGSVVKDNNGTIYFGSQEGVCYFNANNKHKRNLSMPAVVTYFKTYNRKHDFDDKVTLMRLSNSLVLNYQQNTFSIGFNVLDFSLNNKVEFAYRLIGLDNIWHNTLNLNEVTFRNIPPGEYKFELKSRIRNEEWSQEITALKINITPPFWLTWWAKTIYLLIIASIIYIILLVYKREIELKNSLLFQQKENEQIQELNNEKLRFYTNITHELRSPLTLIIGPLEDLLSEQSLSIKLSHKISIIHQNAFRLLNLINQILDFRTTETQNKKLTVTRANLAELINEICSVYKELNQNKHIEIKSFISPTDQLIYFDPEIITSILNNLMSNAIKYTTKGEVNISLHTVIENDTSYTEIVVADTGVGIFPENMGKIFDRYYQGESNKHVSGTGIGLALVKNLTKLHQAEIFVDSKPGFGSTFRFRILTNNSYPNAIHNVDRILENQPLNSESGFTDIINSKHLLLVIEDEIDIQNYIKESFADNFDILTASDGNKGLEKAFSRIPDLIICDIMLPGLNGIELCKILKEDVRTSHIPIILLTAKVTLKDKTEGYYAGADSYITKPFSASLLKGRVYNILEARRKLASIIVSYTAEKRASLIESLNLIDHEFLEKITAIINDNLDSNKIDVAYISNQMNMSHSTLYRKVKALTGVSVNEYVRRIKLQNAEQFLLTGKYSISEVAFKVGINSLTYFRQCFKEEFGSSPSEYIKKVNS